MTISYVIRVAFEVGIPGHQIDVQVAEALRLPSLDREITVGMKSPIPVPCKMVCQLMHSQRDQARVARPQAAGSG
jgi:hypothetical protein